MKKRAKCPECDYEIVTAKKPLNTICPFCGIIMETVKDKPVYKII